MEKEEIKRERQQLVFQIEAAMNRKEITNFVVSHEGYLRMVKFDADGYLRYGDLYAANLDVKTLKRIFEVAEKF